LEEAAGGWANLQVAAALPAKRFSTNSPGRTPNAAPAACTSLPFDVVHPSGKASTVAQAPSEARTRVLAAVPALAGLLADGSPGDQVQSDPLAAGDDPTPWRLWFLLRPGGLVIATPVGQIRADGVEEAVLRCNAYNGGLRWTVLSVAPWEGEQVATLTARLAVPPEDAGRWEAVGAAMEAVLRDAAPARSVLEGLIDEPAV
jgi:hypothetical protein